MDIDQLSRALKDLEAQVREQGYRIKALEKDMPIKYVKHMYPTGAVGKPLFEEQTDVSQFCPCGKDRLLCRAPDCPSHKESK